MKTMSYRVLGMVVAALGLLLTACGGSTGGGGGGGGATVSSVTITNVPSPAQVQVGSTVDLNATVAGSAGVAQSVTWESSDTAVATVNSDGVVTGVSAGSVDITAKSTVDASKSDTVSLTVVAASLNCSSATPLSGTIDTDTVLPLNCFDVSGVLNVNAQLTIPAGATLRFEADAGLSVNSSGALIAKGTAAQPITMTSILPTNAAAPGNWRGIYFASANTLNSLEYLNISYGGGLRYGGTFDEANIYVNNGAKVSIVNSSSTNSQDYGIYVEEGAELLAFSNNTVTDNTQGSLYLAANQVGQLSGSSTFDNAVTVSGATVNNEQTWPKLNQPYVFTGVTIIGSSGGTANITIAPGATLTFATDAGLQVNDGGSLVADGSSEEISFTSAASSPSPGDWRGIYIESNSSATTLTGISASYGGGLRYGGTFDEANVYVNNNARLTLTNSSLSSSEDFGFYAEDGGTIVLDNNSYSGNTQGSISVASNQLGSIDQTNASTYGGDAEARGSVVNTSQTWQASLPYRFTDVTNIRSSSTGADVVVQPGATLTFSTDAGLQVSDGGSFVADGGSDNTITFTSALASPTAGDWRGIYIESNSSINKLNNVTVSYGGGLRYGGTFDEANVYVNNNARLTLTNSTLSNSEDFGFYAEATANVNAVCDLAANNTFTSNAQGGCLIN